jgi:hypothetical protein
MPLIFGTATTSTVTYVNPFVGPPQMPVQLLVDVSTLTAGATGEVDAYGILKPGTPFGLSGGKLVVPVATGGFTYGVTAAPIQLDAAGAATGAVTSTSLDSDTDQPITVYCGGVVNRDLAEDNLGRAYSADEIAGFTIAGSQLRLTET